MCSLLVLGPALASAQSAAKECIPEKGARQTVQQAPIEVFVALRPAHDSADAPAIYLGTLLQEVQLAFTAPDTLEKLPDGMVRVWLHPDGRLTSPQPADTLLPGALVRALTIAIDSVTRRGGIGPVFQPLPRDSVELRLIVHDADARTPLSLPLLRVSLPPFYREFDVDKPALALPGNPAPRYPVTLREEGIEGEVLMQFVVDTAGQADLRTLRLLGPSRVYREFVRSVLQTIPKMKFSPAVYRGCKVRQLVQLPFAFKLNW